TEHLFDFYFRIEIYVPKVKRQYGYYVLPILHGDRLIGRIDPKMDRKTSTLHIHNVYAEKGAPKNKRTIQAIGKSVTSLASFLGAKQINWGNVPSGWDGLK
ncbi:MAG: winged helix-turn-helix domain-containing protein, partial [Chloroflexi bacterium]|nr:winged helix-turn-helix domain-containing protein [Chloroflexota bacterium]